MEAYACAEWLAQLLTVGQSFSIISPMRLVPVYLCFYFQNVCRTLFELPPLLYLWLAFTALSSFHSQSFRFNLVSQQLGNVRKSSTEPQHILKIVISPRHSPISNLHTPHAQCTVMSARSSALYTMFCLSGILDSLS